jgi:type II secretory pathway pseudopilin PulG
VPLKTMKTAKHAETRTPIGLGTAPVKQSFAADVSRTAFTLIEMIGALAVVVILASMAVPVAVRQIDRAAWNAEVATLSSISNAIVMQIIRNKTVSSTNTWASDAAYWAGLPPSRITTTPRNYSRAIFMDTSGWLGSTALPFTQPNTGTTMPTSARLMILSTISTALPSSLGSFNTIWNTPEKTKPTGGGWTSWTGKGEDIVIQRVNLQPLFHRVVLFNRDPSATCNFSIDTTNLVQVNPQYEGYYLHGSVLGMYTNTSLILSEIVNKDECRLFEGGIWSDRIGGGPPSTFSGSTNLDQIAYAFVQSPSPTSTKRGDNTIGVADMLLSYMISYSSWANMSPCFSFSGTGQTKFVPQYNLMNTVVQCLGNSGNGGCQMVP